MLQSWIAQLGALVGKKSALPVETYGKLPCYQDYISVVLTPEANQWRSWLLTAFAGETMPPVGLWPFIYQPRKNARAVIGFIQASSDGRRQFPFSLFAVVGWNLAKDEQHGWATACSVWGQLQPLHSQVVQCQDVRDLFTQLGRTSVIPDPANTPQCPPQLTATPPQQAADWPLLLVGEASLGWRLHLICGGSRAEAECLHNWHLLAGRATPTQPEQQAAPSHPGGCDPTVAMSCAAPMPPTTDQ